VQARRLDDLEKLYRDEVVARKRAHNAVEDLKGKIRVYCRWGQLGGSWVAAGWKLGSSWVEAG
jgi:hypothetical protein